MDVDRQKAWVLWSGHARQVSQKVSKSLEPNLFVIVKSRVSFPSPSVMIPPRHHRLSSLNVLHGSVLLGRAAIDVLDFVCKVRVLDLLRARCGRERVFDAPGDDVVFEEEVD